METAEKEVLEKQLYEHGGDLPAMASTLGIGLSTLYTKLKAHQLR